MHVLIDGRPFQFQPPNNLRSVQMLCKLLVDNGFSLTRQVALARTGPINGQLVSQVMAMLKDRTVNGRLALVTFLVVGKVSLAMPPPPGLLKAPPGVVISRGQQRVFVALPLRDHSIGLVELVAALQAERLTVLPTLERVLSNPRHNLVRWLDARLRRCTRPDILRHLLEEVLPTGMYTIELVQPGQALNLNGSGVHLIIDGKPIVLPPVRTMPQVRLVCGLLTRAGHRLHPRLGHPPFAGDDTMYHEVERMMHDVRNPSGLRRLVAWLVATNDVRLE